MVELKKLKKFKRSILILTILTCANISIFAHPHMWFKNKVDFVFSNDKIKGVFVTWTFEKEFSNEIIKGYDLDRNGKFSKKEALAVYNNAFIYTKNYYYFIFIREGKERFSPKSIDKNKFSVSQKKGIVSYRFFVDLSKIKGREFYFACYDYTFFCDISYTKKNPISFTYNKRKVKPKYKIEENKDYPVYYDPISPPGDSRLYTKKKPGLKVFYPLEVKITF